MSKFCSSIVASQVVWDADLIQKYNYSGPRYTSYPTALEFNEAYQWQDFEQATQVDPQRPLSLYVHIPFCHKLCYFCACNKIVTRNEDKVERYLAVLEQEIAFKAPLFKQRQVTQMHWGGGTPTYLNVDQITRLTQILRQHFNFSDTAEISIEVDPREVELSLFEHLYALGFNRLSMGVQDFDKEVQRLVNREQDEAFIFSLVETARRLGFGSINIDLIYGLPKQNQHNFANTIEKILQLRPDRLSVFNYAHLPSRFAAQRKIKEADLTAPQEKLAILQQTIQRLNQANYQFIGMDHFALPDDQLAVAQRQGVLHRNFQGYTTHGETDLLGLGVSAISMIANHYAQNDKELNSYQGAVSLKGQALSKGLVLSHDDLIRRDVIKSIICNFYLDFNEIAQRYQIDFARYFEEDLQLLQPLIKDGLVLKQPDGLQVTETGRLLVRNICICFDLYFRDTARRQQFSRVI